MRASRLQGADARGRRDRLGPRAAPAGAAASGDPRRASGDRAPARPAGAALGRLSEGRLTRRADRGPAQHLHDEREPSPVDLSRPGRQGLRPLRSRAEAMPFKPASRALSRFTVLDLTRVRSGPTCVRQLADWGANVIKIETPEGLEKGDAPGGPRHGSDFQNLHRNKRSLSLNLKTAAGLDVMKRLVAKADVLVENYRPDVKHRLGIDYETLKAVNPRLVYASISGFGQDGPYRERPGFDQIAQGMGGLMSITGLPGQGPVRVGIPIADLSAGLYCSLGILVALLAREETGEG